MGCANGAGCEGWEGCVILVAPEETEGFAPCWPPVGTMVKYVRYF